MNVLEGALSIHARTLGAHSRAGCLWGWGVHGLMPWPKGHLSFPRVCGAGVAIFVVHSTVFFLSPFVFVFVCLDTFVCMMGSYGRTTMHDRRTGLSPNGVITAVGPGSGGALPGGVPLGSGPIRRAR